jgi:hypothetical protein
MLPFCYQGNEWLVDRDNGNQGMRRAVGGEGASSSAPTQRFAVGAARDDVVCISSDEE